MYFWEKNIQHIPQPFQLSGLRGNVQKPLSSNVRKTLPGAARNSLGGGRHWAAGSFLGTVHPSLPAGLLGIWLNKEHCFPAVRFLARESSLPGSLAAQGESGQPRARRGADDRVVCAQHGAAGACPDGTVTGRVVLSLSARQYSCKGKPPSARKPPCVRHTCSVRSHVRTDAALLSVGSKQLPAR